MANDIDYWRGRAVEERQRADRSDDPAVARLHRELAELCEDRVRALTESAAPAA